MKNKLIRQILTKGCCIRPQFSVPATLIALVMAIGISSAASAATVISADDNLIDSNAPDTVQNSAGDIRTKAGPERAGIIKFVLPGDVNASAAASLRLIVRDADTTAADSYSGTFYGLNSDYTPLSGDLGTDWDETAITWNNAPGWVNGPTSDWTSLGTYTVTGGTTPTYNLPIGALSSFLQSDNTATFVIHTTSRSGGNWLDFWSSETGSSSTAPELSFSVIPEPSSFALVGIGLASVLIGSRLKKRK